MEISIFESKRIKKETIAIRIFIKFGWVKNSMKNIHVCVMRLLNMLNISKIKQHYSFK